MKGCFGCFTFGLIDYHRFDFLPIRRANDIDDGHHLPEILRPYRRGATEVGKQGLNLIDCRYRTESPYE